MQTITINTTPDFLTSTLEEARGILSETLRAMRPADAITEAMGDAIARACGMLRGLSDLLAVGTEALAETVFREAPAPIPSDRPDYSDLVDHASACDPWGESCPAELYDLAA
jgi:hypothetical protein